MSASNSKIDLALEHQIMNDRAHKSSLHAQKRATNHQQCVCYTLGSHQEKAGYALSRNGRFDPLSVNDIDTISIMLKQV